jgi:GH18 family chitinase/enterochelin esterase-like enzyme
MKSTLTFPMLVMILVTAALLAPSKAVHAQSKVVAYVPNWIDLTSFVNDIDYARVTHINIAFENPVNDNGDLSFNSKNEVLIAKAHANHVKILVSIGGGSASGDKTLRSRYFALLSDAKRAGFVAKLADYVALHQFDGLDVDIEGPSINQDYGAFVHDLAQTLKPKGKLLTAALSQGYGGKSVPDSVFADLDLVNIMAYDGAGPWDPNSPGQHSSMDFARSNVAYWLGRGLPKDKAVLGVPFYGYGFGTAFRKRDYPYSAIIASYPGAENADQAGSTIWYNGIPTIREKARYVREQGLAGVMIWSLDYDVKGERSLLSTIDAALRADPSDVAESTIGPTYADAPELTVPDGAPRGTLHEFTMNSTDSKIYPGIAKGQTGTVPYQRKVFVYVPAGYVAGTPAPFLIVQDGGWYKDLVPKVLDTMIYQKRLPAMVAILIDSGGGDAQGSQRGLEYDTVSGTYAGFVEDEVLPRISKDYNITFTKDPDGRATMGGSSGGAAAFTMAWFRPDLYHRVLTYSGTYVNQQWPVNPASPHGAWEYHEHLIPQSERKPLRIWLEVSENDNGSKRDEASLHNWVLANQRMAAALKAKGYTYCYVFAKEAGHTDGRVTRQTLPGALEWLWQGYAAK